MFLHCNVCEVGQGEGCGAGAALSEPGCRRVAGALGSVPSSLLPQFKVSSDTMKDPGTHPMDDLRESVL